MTDFKIPTSRSHRLGSRSRQGGVILAVTMIVLVILLVSSVALIRSFNAAVSVSGALALRRDLVNQSERAVSYVTNSAFSTTGTNQLTQAMRFAPQSAFNYTPCQLPVDTHGVPTILSDTDANFTTTNDLTAEPWTVTNASGSCQTAFTALANDIPDPTGGTGITVRFVIDRLCSQPGDYGSTFCTTTPKSISKFKDQFSEYLNSTRTPVYRLSVRAIDPRGATTFVQTTFSN